MVHLRGTISRIGPPAIAGLIILHTTVLPQVTPSQLEAMSEKKLYKEFDRAYSQRRLDYAYEVLKLALLKRNRGRKKPKPHKVYTPLFRQLSANLADREALRGIEACNRMDLDTCRDQISKARNFQNTEKVAELEALLNANISELEGRFSAAKKQADGGEYDSSLKTLKSLNRFRDYLPELDSEIGKVRSLFVEALVRAGGLQLEARRWDDAESSFQRALAEDPGNPKAKLALEKAGRGRQADEIAKDAAARLSEKAFNEAVSRVDEAIEIYPEAEYLVRLKERISKSWVDDLAVTVPRLLNGVDTFENARDAKLSLAKIAELEPSHALVSSRLAQAEEAFAWSCLQRALIEGDNPARMASAYAMAITAQRRLGPNVVRQEQVKDAASRFNRKRASQLVLSVENLTGAPEDFLEAVFARTLHSIENMAMPDLRVRTRDQYSRSPDEDPEFQDLRPDGKSATALLRIGISQHLSERWPAPPQEVKSRYVVGEETVINPEWEQKRKELTDVRLRLDDPKSKDRKKGVVTERMYEQMKMEFEKIPRTLSVPKLGDYTYLRIHYQQETQVELRVTLSDLVTREVIAKDVIRFTHKDEGEELSNVRERDESGVRNQEVRLPDPKQVLQKAQRDVLASLERKAGELLASFTHRFYFEGERLHQMGRSGDAAEHFLCHWAFFRGRLDPPESDVVERVLREQLGVDLTRDGQTLLSMVARVAPAAP